MHRRSMVMVGDGMGFSGAQVIPVSGMPQIPDSALTGLDSGPLPQSEQGEQAQPVDYDELIQFLSVAKSEDSPELDKLRRNLYFEAQDLKTRIGEFVGQLIAGRNAALSEKREALRERGRALDERLATLQSTEAAALGRFNETLDKVAKAQASLLAAKDEKRMLSRWASQKERDSVDVKIAEAKAAQQEAHAKNGAASQRLNAASAEVFDAQEERKKLLEEDKEIEAHLAGREYLPYGLGVGGH